MKDEYSELRAAFHAGATIQAYTVEGDDGQTPLAEVEGRGHWRSIFGEPSFTCDPSRYRLLPEFRDCSAHDSGELGFRIGSEGSP